MAPISETVEFVQRSAAFKEVAEQYMDSSKIKALGWEPKTTIIDGLEQTIKYYNEVFKK